MVAIIPLFYLVGWICVALGWNPDYGLTAASVFGAVWFSGYFDYCVQSMALKKRPRIKK